MVSWSFRSLTSGSLYKKGDSDHLNLFLALGIYHIVISRTDVVHMHPINGFNTKSLTLNHFAMVHTSHLVLAIQGDP